MAGRLAGIPDAALARWGHVAGRDVHRLLRRRLINRPRLVIDGAAGQRYARQHRRQNTRPRSCPTHVHLTNGCAMAKGWPSFPERGLNPGPAAAQQIVTRFTAKHASSMADGTAIGGSDMDAGGRAGAE